MQGEERICNQFKKLCCVVNYGLNIVLFFTIGEAQENAERFDRCAVNGNVAVVYPLLQVLGKWWVVFSHKNKGFGPVKLATNRLEWRGNVCHVPDEMFNWSRCCNVVHVNNWDRLL
jgi:hypothetical protein